MTNQLVKEFDWHPFSLAWSPKQACGSEQIAVGSMVLNRCNYIDVIDLEVSKKRSKLGVCQISIRQILRAEHQFAPTRIKWAPENCPNNLLASAGSNISIFQFEDAELGCRTQLFKKKTGILAPITSIDWNPCDPNILASASIDTTCTIWDLCMERAKTQLIAHDNRVYDLCFSTSTFLFASVGGDGSVRIFDLRNLDRSTILYEAPDRDPLLRVSWNRSNPHFILTFGERSKTILLLDTRLPSTPLAELCGHKDLVNDVSWAPHSPSHCVTTSDDGQLLIWNLLQNTNSVVSPQLGYQLDSEGVQLAWPSTLSDHVAITCKTGLHIMAI